MKGGSEHGVCLHGDLLLLPGADRARKEDREKVGEEACPRKLPIEQVIVSA